MHILLGIYLVFLQRSIGSTRSRRTSATKKPCRFVPLLLDGLFQLCRKTTTCAKEHRRIGRKCLASEGGGTEEGISR